MTNYKEYIEKSIDDRILLIKRNNDVMNKVMPILVKWEGKQVTKRLITKLEEELTDFHFYLHKGYFYYELGVSKGSFRMTINLCPIDNKKFSMESFKEQNIYLLNISKDYDKLVEGKTHVTEWVEKIKKIKKMKEELEKEMGLFNCQYLISVNQI